MPHVPQADWEVPCVQGMGSLHNASGRMQLSCTQRRRPNISSMHAAAYSLQGSFFWLETVVVLNTVTLFELCFRRRASLRHWRGRTL